MLLAVSAPALAQVSTTIDLRTPEAFENLKRGNPAHFEKIRQILLALEEEPNRVEGDWLQVNHDAREVALMRAVIKTSNPPKQILSFRLESVRYTMYLVRRDMGAEFQPLN